MKQKEVHRLLIDASKVYSLTLEVVFFFLLKSAACFSTSLCLLFPCLGRLHLFLVEEVN